MKIKLILEKLMSNRRIEQETLKLKLVFGDNNFEFKGQSGWFEDEMAELQKQLPSGYYFKCCFGCL